jgi:exopolysaccharide biosynthesis polyprenyl glycosylphosphotransferase
MLKERAREVATVVVLLDLALLGLAFAAAFAIRSWLLPIWLPELPVPSRTSLPWLFLLSIPTFAVSFHLMGLYESLRTRTVPELVWLVARPIALGGVVLGSAIFLFHALDVSRYFFGIFLVLFFLFVLVEKIAIRVAQRTVRRRGFNYRSILIVGVNEGSMRIADAVAENRDYGFKVAGFVNGFDQEFAQVDSYKVFGSILDLPAILDQNIVDEIVFALPVDQIARCERLIRSCAELGLKIHIRADFVHSLLSRTYLGTVSGIPILTLASTPHSGVDTILKRLIDLSIAGAGLILAAPGVALIAILIKIDSKGPVLFRQVRVGLNGRRFVLLKFRSMVHDAERQRRALEGLNEMRGPVFKIRRDPRVTRVGRFLRRTSLDELPQLWNVLRGDMSLVGPRPPLPSEVKLYERWQRRRLSVKPGVTCLWQINGRNNVDFDEWMKLDMQYIDNWSLGLDFKILAKTIPAVLFTRGAH